MIILLIWVVCYLVIGHLAALGEKLLTGSVDHEEVILSVCLWPIWLVAAIGPAILAYAKWVANLLNKL